MITIHSPLMTSAAIARPLPLVFPFLMRPRARNANTTANNRKHTIDRTSAAIANPSVVRLGAGAGGAPAQPGASGPEATGSGGSGTAAAEACGTPGFPNASGGGSPGIGHLLASGWPSLIKRSAAAPTNNAPLTVRRLLLRRLVLALRRLDRRL